MKILVFNVRITRIEIHLSVLLLFSYLFYQGWILKLHTWQIITACLILLGSVLVHELAHVAAFSQLLGIRSQVLILAVGGAAIPLEKEPTCRGWRFAMVALAGPLANLLLAVLAVIVLVASQDQVTFNLALTSCLLNVVLGVLNLIPSRPFDGGHMFAMLLEELLGHPRLADFFARTIGSLCGCLLMLASYYLRDPFMGLGALASLWANSPLSSGRS